MLDLIEEYQLEASNHRLFVRCVGALASYWRQAGLIIDQERASIVRCVPRSNGHSNPKALHVGPTNMKDAKE